MAFARKIKVLLADDSAFMRRELSRILEADGEFEVIAAVRNGQEAVLKARETEPDVVALDINMPVMDGLTALQHIMVQSPRPCIVISSLTQEGSVTAFEALELGAIDFIPKPGGTISADIGALAPLIRRKVKEAAGSSARAIRRRTRQEGGPSLSFRFPARQRSRRIILIGQSTGGPNTILEVLPRLPADLGCPILLVQHMPGFFTPSFAERLDKSCSLRVAEAVDGEMIQPGRVYLAPGDRHMTVGPHPDRPGTALWVRSQPEGTLFKPSVDVTLGSVVKRYGRLAIGVLLTGMGDDGADAMASLKRAGGRTIAESEETAIVFGMPKEAIRRGGAEFVLPAPLIAEKLVALLEEEMADAG